MKALYNIRVPKNNKLCKYIFLILFKACCLRKYRTDFVLALFLLPHSSSFKIKGNISSRCCSVSSAQVSPRTGVSGTAAVYLSSFKHSS